jgi:hypothetical protein
MMNCRRKKSMPKQGRRRKEKRGKGKKKKKI